VQTLKKGLNFTLITTLGPLDLFGEIVGGGGYEELQNETIKIQVAGVECLCLSLERLIEVKRAAGRPKDLEAIAELEQILEEARQA
jgi:predicted nucleotidyltransferase